MTKLGDLYDGGSKIGEVHTDNSGCGGGAGLGCALFLILPIIGIWTWFDTALGHAPGRALDSLEPIMLAATGRQNRWEHTVGSELLGMLYGVIFVALVIWITVALSKRKKT